MKIVVLDGNTVNPGDVSWEELERQGEFTCHDRTAGDQIRGRIGAAELVLTNKTPLSAETLAACPGIRYIGVLATGYNVVDVEAARERGIVVTNIPDYSSDAVAQFTFALLLEVCHHVGHHAETVREGRWSASLDFCYWDYPLVELHGKTLGVVGFGHIGRAVARIAVAMGMDVLAYAGTVRKELETDRIRYAPLEELLAKSDVVSLHLPLHDDTRGMIDARSIAGMKDGAILVNTARGPLIVEEDVAAALESGKLHAYAADVASVEPIVPDNPLLAARNCILTPHIAWAPVETRRRLLRIAAENLAAFIAGKPINVVG